MEKSPNILIFVIATIVLVVGVFFILNKFGGSTSMANEGKTVAQNGDRVYVNYTGKLEDGTIFDTSANRGVPFDFVLGSGMVIKGWDEGILGMKKGEKKTLTISPDKGYGAAGVPGAIPANATLIFDVELVDIK